MVGGAPAAADHTSAAVLGSAGVAPRASLMRDCMDLPAVGAARAALRDCGDVAAAVSAAYVAVHAATAATLSVAAGDADADALAALVNMRAVVKYLLRVGCKCSGAAGARWAHPSRASAMGAVAHRCCTRAAGWERSLHCRSFRDSLNAVAVLIATMGFMMGAASM